MLIYQLVIIASIFIAFKINSKVGEGVTFLWIVFTFFKVYTPWLSLLQFFVIFLSRAVAKEIN
jgi:hypothetical protein